MFMPFIPYVPNRGESKGSKPAWLKLDPDEQYVRSYTPVAAKQALAGFLGLIVALQAGLMTFFGNSQESSSGSGDEVPWILITILVVIILLFVLLVVGFSIRMRGAYAVHLTTKAFVFKHKGNWAALPLTDVTRVEQRGILGKHQIFVYSGNDPQPMIRLVTTTPDYVIDEILRLKEAAVKATGNKNRW